MTLKLKPLDGSTYKLSYVRECAVLCATPYVPSHCLKLDTWIRGYVDTQKMQDASAVGVFDKQISFYAYFVFRFIVPISLTITIIDLL